MERLFSAGWSKVMQPDGKIFIYDGKAQLIGVQSFGAFRWEGRKISISHWGLFEM